MAHTNVITRRGGTPQKAIEYIKRCASSIMHYRVIVLHVGTNWLSQKDEWFLYLKMLNGQYSKEEYDFKIASLNPPPATGSATTFRDTYQDLINLIKEVNKEAVILISAIIPRTWDHDRRHLVRKSYNQILKKLSNQDKVFFIPSYKPFFDKNKCLKKELFACDGLHLSDKGAVVLRTFFCEKIDKALKGLLK